jgi:hypothetical protein
VVVESSSTNSNKEVAASASSPDAGVGDGSADGKGQRQQRTEDRVVGADRLEVGILQRDRPEAVQQGVERDPGLEPGQGRADAEVDAFAERDVGALNYLGSNSRSVTIPPI